MIKVNEIFKSIQGESSFAGLPCVFVRLTGCNLRCSYCDTTYAYEEGAERPVDEIVAEARSRGCDLVEITGGEPLLQMETPELARSLLDEGHRVLVETNGSLDIDALPKDVVRIMDIKCPDSGMSDKMDWGNIERLKSGSAGRPSDEVKFVLGSRRDYEWARDVIHRHRLSERAHVLISCVFGEADPAAVVRWMLDDGLDARFQLQLHKHIWRPGARSV